MTQSTESGTVQERLREQAAICASDYNYPGATTLNEAADIIDRLQAQLTRTETALDDEFNNGIKLVHELDHLQALPAQGGAVCEDCPPVGYPTDKTRCTPRPRRETACYIERSMVRGIICGVADEYVHVTEGLLADVDALHIYVADDFCAASPSPELRSPGRELLLDALQTMTDDCEHLLNILERKSEQEWNYEYQIRRIKDARAAALPLPSPSGREEIQRLIEQHLASWIPARLDIIGAFPTSARQDARDLADAILQRFSIPHAEQGAGEKPQAEGERT